MPSTAAPCSAPRQTWRGVLGDRPAGQEVPGAIKAHEEDAWATIPYWLSSLEVSGADVAETYYTAFSVKEVLTVRLVVRRVPPPSGGQFTFHHLGPPRVRHNRPGDLRGIEADHRRHAVVELRITELKSGSLARPTGMLVVSAGPCATRWSSTQSASHLHKGDPAAALNARLLDSQGRLATRGRVYVATKRG